MHLKPQGLKRGKGYSGIMLTTDEQPEQTRRNG